MIDRIWIAKLRAALVFLLAFLWLCSSGAAVAQERLPQSAFTVSHLDQVELDNDGAPDLTILAVAFHTSADLVLVYDGAEDMAAADDWREATDFDNDVWLFDAGGDGDIELIVVFAVEGGRHTARLYDDRDGDGRVHYRENNGQITVLESSFWTVEVVAEGPWYAADGAVNRNVTFRSDGPLGMRGLDIRAVLEREINDGQVDLVMECHAGTWQDMTAYCLTQLLLPSPWSIGRTKLHVAVPGYPLPEIAGFVFWPHLGPGRYTPQKGREIGAALQMDWDRGQLGRSGINNLVNRENPEAGWWLFSTVAVTKGQTNLLDNENPFVYYDLAADRDGWPELIVRHVYSPVYSVRYQAGGSTKQLTDPQRAHQVVRYSWDADNDGYWDYKLGLIGQNRMETVLAFPDFDIVSIPHGEVPWVLTEGMQWAGATFVQVDIEQEASNEGIYDWDGISQLSREFMSGLEDQLSVGTCDARAMFRGEYSTKQLDKLRLYFSPLDRKLHLLGAQAGVWNLDYTRRVRYADLDGDGYLDQWALTTIPNAVAPEQERIRSEVFGTQAVPEELTKSLQIASGIVVYGDGDRVKWTRSPIAPSMFEVLPPRDHAEWLALGQRLERYGRDFAPDDFLGMLEQFSGPTTEVQGAVLEDFRVTDSGFRFVLHLRLGCRVVADENRAGLAHLVPGSYVVAYNGAFVLRPLTPPRVVLPVGEISCDPAAPEQMAWTTVRAVMHNAGLQDVRSLPVRLYAAREGDEALLLAEERVSIPSEGQYTLVHRWPPLQPGRWTIWVEADAARAVPASIELGDMASVEIEVRPAALPDVFQPAAPFDGVRFTSPVALLLASAALAAVSALGIILTQARRRPVAAPWSEE